MKQKQPKILNKEKHLWKTGRPKNDSYRAIPKKEVILSKESFSNKLKNTNG